MASQSNTQVQYRPAILYVDAFDSFSNNIVALIEELLDVEITILSSDQAVPHFLDFIQCFDAVVLGPGPGNPVTSEGIGLFKRILMLKDDNIPPIFGICLGFQSLAFKYGAKIERLNRPQHGMVHEIRHNRLKPFPLSTPIESTQYHSLCVRISHTMEKPRPVLHPIDITGRLPMYTPTDACPRLLPLAWDVEEPENGYVLMAVRHVERPLVGIQFHPESISSSDEARQIITSWWSSAVAYNLKIGRKRLRKAHIVKALDGSTLFGLPKEISLLSRQAYFKGLPTSTSPNREISASTTQGNTLSLPQAPEGAPSQGANGSSLQPNLREPQRSPSSNTTAGTTPPEDSQHPPHHTCQPPLEVHTARIHAPGLDAVQIGGILGLRASQCILLDSSVLREGLSRHSIIGIVQPGETRIIQHTIEDPFVTVRVAGSDPATATKHFFKPKEEVWDFLAAYVEERKVEKGGSARSPFWGGLMGYLSYEARTPARYKHEPAGECKSRKQAKHPDVLFAWIERSIVIDHATDNVYIQSMGRKNNTWRKSVEEQIKAIIPALPTPKSAPKSVPTVRHIARTLENIDVLAGVDSTDRTVSTCILAGTTIIRPEAKEYKKKVRRCLELIHAGEAYELCLTDQATVLVACPPPPFETAWPLYLHLRSKNPSPFGAYLRLGRTTIISSSPERFLSWTRDGKTCQLRPIKGTVRKTPGMTRQEATRILSEPKEVAENVMIVDLIRHDLHGVLGAGRVRVPALCVVEEYETVFQLVSVIEGDMHGAKPHTPDADDDDQANRPYTGLDVLRAALPPGSMTGAPKLAACSALHKLEHHKPRGCYSGVLGYMCAGGGGDFSVLIRCAYRADGDEVIVPLPEYAGGAGGGAGKVGKAGQKKQGDAMPALERRLEVWRVGAGGAVTALSSDIGEWEEMNVKLDATLAAFQLEEGDLRLFG